MPTCGRSSSATATHPEKESSEIAWLRAYSNYLTPRLGLFSADTWTAAALFVRNLILNWLVLLSALCLFLLVVKAFTVGTFSLAGVGRLASSSVGADRRGVDDLVLDICSPQSAEPQSL